MARKKFIISKLVLTLFSGVVASVVAGYFLQAAHVQPKKELSAYYKTRNIELDEAFKILFVDVEKGINFDKLYITVATIENVGDLAIRPIDIEKNITLYIDNSHEILKAFISGCAFKRKKEISSGTHFITIPKILINPGEKLTLTILCKLLSERPSDIILYCDARISDLQKISIIYNNFIDNQWKELCFILSICIILLISYCIIQHSNIRKQNQFIKNFHKEQQNEGENKKDNN